MGLRDSFAKTCGPEVFGLTGALEPVAVGVFKVTALLHSHDHKRHIVPLFLAICKT
jgi:hypothetical protein